MARVWIFQQPREKKALGDKAPWYVGWYQGRSRRSKKIGTKTAARAYQSRLEAAANALRAARQSEDPTQIRQRISELSALVQQAAAAGAQGHGCHPKGARINTRQIA